MLRSERVKLRLGVTLFIVDRRLAFAPRSLRPDRPPGFGDWLPPGRDPALRPPAIEPRVWPRLIGARPFMLWPGELGGLLLDEDARRV